MENVTLHLNGQDLFIRLWGDPANPPLIMLHGFPENADGFRELAPLLAGDFYCIVPNQRGYGRSSAPEGIDNYRVSALTADILALIDHFSPDTSVALLGHDWGAAVAYSVAIAAPARIAKLVIMNGVHPIPFQDALGAGGAQTEASQYINWLRDPGSTDQLAANDFTKMVAMFRHGMDTAFLTPERLAEYKTEWARPGRMDAMINWYRASPLRVPAPGKTLPAQDRITMDPAKMRITMPHLLIWGEADNALKPETRDAIAPLCDDLKIVLIADADHWLHHQKPAEIAAEILNFL